MNKIVVKKEGTLLEYLVENSDYSRNKVKNLLKYHMITIKGVKQVKHDTPVKPKQIILISSEKKETKIGNIDIIYEDENYLVVNKPSGMLTVSTEKEKNRTLYHFVRQYIKEQNKNQKIFIVHRLDRETSGLVLFAKSEDLKRKLQENWELIALKRKYQAVVSGILEKKENELIDFLKENSQNRVFISHDKTGKRAVTRYKVIRENKNSLLDIDIETGRKNQIRVQLASINHPILGDMKYGNVKAKRLFLHANLLTIRDPKTGKLMTFESNTPRDFLRQL